MTVKSKDTTIYQAALKVAVWENVAIVEAITEVVRNVGFYFDEHEKTEERLRNINGPYGKVYWKLLKQRGFEAV